MKKELEDNLFNKYPYLYRGRNESIQTNLMPFGFECGDGWYDLINTLSGFIHERLSWNPKLSKDFKVMQVKEKFGGLRFYVEGADGMIDWLIDNAENRSFYICETCGNSGELIEFIGWLKTMCFRCLVKHFKKENTTYVESVSKFFIRMEDKIIKSCKWSKYKTEECLKIANEEDKNVPR